MPSFDQSILVSPPFSCGAGLLIDILLRLEIRVTRPFGEYWHESPTGFVPNDTLKHEYSAHSVHIGERNAFTFPDRKSACFEHRLDMATLPARAHILLVRDPVDAVFSWHRRFDFASRGLSFEAYLRNVSVFPHHLPYNALIATPLDLYAVFVAFWMLAAENLLIVRYEDLKQDPVREVSRILAAMGAGRPGADIAEAAHRSSFNMIRARGDINPFWSETNQRSQVFEWRERMSPAARGVLTQTEPLAAVCRRLSYETASTAGEEIFRHGSLFWSSFAEGLADLRSGFPDGRASPDAYVAACMSLAGSLGGRIRTARINDVSIDTDDLSAFTSIITVMKILGDVFRNAPPQPVAMLERLAAGLPAMVANSSAGHGIRAMSADIRLG